MVPVVVPAELPTADVVVVRDRNGSVIVFVDPRVPQVELDETLAHLDLVMAGPAYALG